VQQGRKIFALIGEAFAVITLAVLVIPLVISLYKTPTYEATVKMLVSQEWTEGPTTSWDGGDPQETVLAVYRVVDVESVVRAAIEQLKLPDLDTQEMLLEDVSVEPDPGTMFINVSYRDSDPRRAQLIANTIAEMSSQKISDGMPGANSIVAKIWQPATLPENPVSPNLALNMLLALTAWGLLLGLLIAVSLSKPTRTLQKNEAEYTTHSIEAAKEQELLEALGRRGELTAAGAALETSLTVEEADRMLSRLAAKGHLRVRASESSASGGLFYSFWPTE
jgi:capsular polysaccharide biosynthesis protein